MPELSKILQRARSWDDVYKALVPFNTKRDSSAGELLEEFCKLYYLIEPTVREDFKNVWLFKELPPRIRKRLNVSTVDHGIDLVLEDKEGLLHVVQCKFRNNQSSKLSWSKDKIANIFAEGDKADYFIIFTNASGLDKHTLTKKESRLKLVSLGDLIEISPETIKTFRKYLKSKVIPKPKPKKPRPYQRKAINAVVSGLKEADRGQLILPCGAGKTLISLWIQQAMNSKRTLVLVPSLALLRQIKKEWSANGQNLPYLCVCSEKDIDKGTDKIVTHTYEIPGNVTTSPQEIKSFIKAHKKFIIYSTYQSLDAIAKAIKPTQTKFDLAICDEAHKTAGAKKGKFALIHDDRNVSVIKRVYMTATPRIISAQAKGKLSGEEIEYLCDMDNPEIFGQELHRMTFKEAIEKNILVDYKIVAIGIDDKELQREIKKKRYVNEDYTIDQIANNFAIEKFMEKYNAKHSISFHSSIKKANGFKERHKELFPSDEVFHVNGSMSTCKRIEKMHEFIEADKSIITNARCLTEGVDVPAIDAVYFCDPKNSIIDIVQATGRALRRAEGKELGYVVVPIFHRKGEDLAEAVDSNDFKNLIQIVKALSTQDERITDYIKNIKLGEKGTEQGIDEDQLIVGHEKIIIDLVEGRLKESIFDQVIDKTPIPWRTFKEARDFVRSLEISDFTSWRKYSRSDLRPIDIPSNPNRAYKKQGWLSWGDWLGTNVISSSKKKFLPFSKARLLVHRLNLKNEAEWRAYIKDGLKPHNIPSSPAQTYKEDGWAGMGDWLGTGNVSGKNKVYRNFKDAKKFVRSLKLNSQKEWQIYCKSGKKPQDIPTAAHQVYKNLGWNGYADWLGALNIAKGYKKFLGYEEAKDFVRSLKLSSVDEWRRYCKNMKRNDIPKSPHETYRNDGWVSWADWLGTDFIYPGNREYMSFEEAKKFVLNLQLSSSKEWYKFCKSGNKPDSIPASADRIYRKEGWISWADFLGSKNTATNKIEYRSFEDARNYIRKLQLANLKEWNEFCKSGEKPDDIPSKPSRTYKDKGWKGLSDWLGTNNVAKRYSQYRDFREARKFARSLSLSNVSQWREFCIKGNKPSDIPSAPDQCYKKQGWISWYDWLGKGHGDI